MGRGHSLPSEGDGGRGKKRERGRNSNINTFFRSIPNPLTSILREGVGDAEGANEIHDAIEI